jgi:hypothetical protein
MLDETSQKIEIERKYLNSIGYPNEHLSDMIEGLCAILADHKLTISGLQRKIEMLEKR